MKTIKKKIQEKEKERKERKETGLFLGSSV